MAGEVEVREEGMRRYGDNDGVFKWSPQHSDMCVIQRLFVFWFAYLYPRSYPHHNTATNLGGIPEPPADHPGIPVIGYPGMQKIRDTLWSSKIASRAC